MPSTSNNALLKAALAGTVLLTVGLTASYFTSSTSSSADGDDEEEEHLEPELIVAIFDKICLNQQGKIKEVVTLVDTIRQQGQSIPDDQVMAHMKQEFVKALIAFQAEMFQAYDVTEEEVKSAVDYYKNNVEVVNSINRLKKLHAVVEPSMYTPKVSIDLTKMLVVIEVYFATLNDIMRSVVEDSRAQGLDPSDRTDLTTIEQEFARRISKEMEEELTSKAGIDQEQFQQAMEKYQREPAMTAKLGALHANQQREFAMMGLPTA